MASKKENITSLQKACAELENTGIENPVLEIKIQFQDTVSRYSYKFWGSIFKNRPYSEVSQGKHSMGITLSANNL